MQIRIIKQKLPRPQIVRPQIVQKERYYEKDITVYYYFFVSCYGFV